MTLVQEKLRRWLPEMGNFHFPKKNPNQNIGLEGDLDDVELLQHVEESFSIKISDADSYRIKNVGEFYEVVLAEAAKAELHVSWSDFLEAISSHARIPVSEIRKETEFYQHIKRWEI